MIDKTLKKLKTRNTQSNIKQFLAVILIVFLSTVLFLGFAVNWWSLKRSVDLYYSETNLANLWINVDDVTAEDEEFFEQNALEYDSRLTFSTDTVIRSGLKIDSNIYVSDGKLNTPYVSDKTKGCFIDEKTAKDNEVVFGFDKLSFEYNQGNDIVRLEFIIVGTMNFSEQILNDDVKPVFIDESVFLDKLNEKLAENSIPAKTSLDYNQILVKCNDADEMKKLISEHYKSSSSSLELVYGRDDVESVAYMNEEIQNAKLIMILFASIFIVVSILLVLATIRQFISQEMSRIGTFKSLGIKNSKIVKFYSGFGSYLCLIGSVVGSVISPLVVPSVMMSTYENVYSIPSEYLKVKLPIVLMLATILIFTICGFIVARCEAARVIKGNPIDCYNLVPAHRVRGLKSKEKSLKMPLFLKSALRYMKQNLARNVMMMVGVFGSTALLFTSFVAPTSLKNSDTFAESRFEGIFAMMNIVRVFAILLVIVVVTGSVMMILSDRKREIATFKLLGIKKNTMILSLVTETFSVLLIGFAIGVLGGVGMTILTLNTLQTFGITIALNVNFLDVFLSFLIPFLVELLLMLYSMVWIKKLNALNTLKTIE